MNITTIPISNYKNNYNLFQLQLLLDVYIIIPKEGLVYIFTEILKGVDLTKDLTNYRLHGNQIYNPLSLLKMFLFAFVDNKRTLRQMEHAYKVNISYLWLSNETTLSFMTIQRFI